MENKSTEIEQTFLENTIKLLVSKPEDVKITRTEDGMGVLYSLKVHEDDIFRIIGKEGQTVNALRILLRTIGYSNKVRASLKLDVEKINQKK
jgi:uncharacterized protein